MYPAVDLDCLEAPFARDLGDAARPDREAQFAGSIGIAVRAVDHCARAALAMSYGCRLTAHVRYAGESLDHYHVARFSKVIGLGLAHAVDGLGCAAEHRLLAFDVAYRYSLSDDALGRQGCRQHRCGNRAGEAEVVH